MSEQLFTLEGRQRIVKRLAAGGRRFAVCERGFLDTDEGLPVKDQAMLRVVTDAGLDLTVLLAP